jgi:hypothetical protein
VFFQQFLAATSPVSFFIKIYSRDGTKGFQETHENRTTGEQLIVRSSSNWTIGRCPLGVDVTTWLKEMAEEMEAFGSFDLESKIELRKPLLGSVNICLIGWNELSQSQITAQWNLAERKMRNPMLMAVVSSKKRRQN